MNVKQELQKLGFSPQDAEVYLAILKVGESAVGPIITKTGFHRDLVYGALTRLEQQGLVQSVEKKKIRHYQAADPKMLARREKERADVASNLLPQLHALYHQPDVSVRIYEGSEGLEEIEKDWAESLKDKEEFYCIGGAGNAWYEVAKPFYRKYHEKLLKRGITLKTVTFQNESKEIIKYENPKFNPVRILSENFRVPASTIIYADKLVINVFGERFIAILIQSKRISDAYRHYFHSLWKMAKPAK